MFIILSYDVEIKRNAKMRKTIKKYLNNVHESVFDGYISDSNLKCLKEEIYKIINPERDSVVIYKDNFKYSISKEYIGLCKNINNDII